MKVLFDQMLVLVSTMVAMNNRDKPIIFAVFMGAAIVQMLFNAYDYRKIQSLLVQNRDLLRKRNQS